MTEAAATEGKTYNLSPEETQRQVSEKIKNKGRKAVEKKNKVLKRLKVQYVNVNDLKPNDYNPNRQSEHDFELLLRSMEEDGFTQPIVALKDGTIVDGEHRWRAAITLGFDEIPVVYTDMTPEQMKISTLRHNRARGSEDIDLTAQVLRDLEELGALDWAQDSLMMDDTEIQRLMEDMKADEALADEEFSEAWEPDKIGADDLAMAEKGDSSKYTIESEPGTTFETAMSKRAIADIRKREEKLRTAKTKEERDMAKKESGLYRLSLMFSGDEAVIVKRVLGKHPTDIIIEMCKEYESK